MRSMKKLTKAEKEQIAHLRRLNRFKKELAEQIYDKHRRKPPSINEQIYYNERKGCSIRIPEEFIYCGDHLTNGEKVTWLALYSHNWDPNPAYRVSWPGKKRLAIIIGKSERQVAHYLKGLIRKGLLLTKKRLNKTTLYLVLNPPMNWMEETKRKIDALRERPEEADVATGEPVINDRER